MLQLKCGKSWDFHRVNISSRELNRLYRMVQEVTEFNYFSLALAEPLPAFAPIVHTFNNFPKEFNDTYDKEQCWKDDPIFNHMGREEFTVWSLSLDKKHPMSKLLEYGKEIKDGVTYWFPQCNGTVASVSLAGPRSITKAYAQSIFFKVYTLHKTEFNILLGRRGVSDDIYRELLTAPELRILRLTADGLTAEEIAERIFLTQSTVQFHIKNTISKLSCRNKVQAIAKAALIGIL